MVSRLKESVIDIGSARIGQVRDVVDPYLVRTCERLPVTIQGPIRVLHSELASGRPVLDVACVGFRTVGIGFLERIEALLDHPGLDRPALDNTGDEDSDNEVEDCASTASSSSLCNITQRAGRRIRIPRMMPLHKLRTFAVQLSRSATLKVTVVCMQDTASAVMKRLRVQDARQLLDRAQLAERQELEQPIEQSATTALATRVAKKGCERLLGEWLTSAILGRLVGGEPARQPVAVESGLREEIQLELFEVKQPGEASIEELDSDDERDTSASQAASSQEAPALASAAPSNRSRTSTEAEPMEFRLIVKNSFIELDEPSEVDPCSMRRAQSWESMRSLHACRHRKVSSEPFTVLATMEPLGASPMCSPMHAASAPPAVDTFTPPLQAVSVASGGEAASSTEPFSPPSSAASAFVAPVSQPASPTNCLAPALQSQAGSSAAASSSAASVWSVTAAVCAFGPPQSPAAASLQAPTTFGSQVAEATFLGSAAAAPAAATAASAAPAPAPGLEMTPPWMQGAAEAAAAGVDEGRTTVMLRNIPGAYSRTELISLLDIKGFCGRYTFVYVPVDFTRNIGLGYALVCMASPLDAEQLLEEFNNLVEWGAPEHGSCPCEASWSEPRQGLPEHVERYRNSPVMHKTVPDEYKPVLFEGSVRIAFPAPTKAIRPPRIRHIKQ